MENSLRNHALVQQQNQLQQRSREEYYRNNGIARSSPMSSAPAPPPSRGSTMSSAVQQQPRTMANNHSRNSASTGSSNSLGRVSSRSGEASDEAVQGITGSLPQRNNRHQPQHLPLQQQQQLPQHQHQQLHRQHPQHHSQHHHNPQLYSNLHQQQQHLQQGYQHPQHHQFYGSTGGNIRIQQQLQEQHEHYYSTHAGHNNGHHRGSYESGSQHSGSHLHHQFHQQQQQQQQQPYYGGVETKDHYSNILGSISSSHQSFEDSYRRIQLPVPAPLPVRSRFVSPSSCFKPFREVVQEEPQPQRPPNKNHNLIRKMTLRSKDLFRVWHAEHSRTHTSHTSRTRRRKSGGSSSIGSSSSRASNKSAPSSSNNPRSISPHRRSFAQMSLGNGATTSVGGHANRSLSAVIESASQNSNSTATLSTTAKSRNQLQMGGGGSVRSRKSAMQGDATSERSEGDKSRASSSIATRSSMGTRNSTRSFGTILPRGKCLTQPADPSGENGADNFEGNLILFENDIISVPRKQVHVLTKGKIPKSQTTSDFRVQSLLGQGTFAQVFKCLHTNTGQMVAVKIVKNKPAYTRQAAVEIDVIRVANEGDGKSSNSISPEKSSQQSKHHQQQQHPNGSDYMIDLVCYFMYKDHLCLVFELLGLNLYEVLKKRQFRGLPLSVTQTLVKQAILGVRALAQKSIVHCDLKPENILLVDEDDEASVMSAGERKQFVAANNSSSSTTSTNSNSNSLTHSSSNDPTSSDNSHSNGGSNDNSKSTNGTTTAAQETPNKKQQQHHPQHEMTPTEPSTKSHSPMDSTLATNETKPHAYFIEKIKLIDFGSACFEGQISHTYIQSRFYRSPEVLLGLAYDSAIDMWSLGCVAAELFLGLPILPGVHEHDQLARICEMVGDVPDWMLDQGTKSSKYFVKYFPSPTPTIQTPPIHSSSASPDDTRSGSTESFSQTANTPSRTGSEGPRLLPQWRIKTQPEYISSLSQTEIKKKGGLAKLEKQPGNRYFKRKLLSDIVLHKGQCGKQEDLRFLKSFIHFLYGILDPDPWKRWTAFQVASHPFLTGAAMEENVDPSEIKDENHANRLFNIYWEAPSDPTIYQRKLRSVQRTRERQQAARRNLNRSHNHNRSRSESPSSQDGLRTLRTAISNQNNLSDGVRCLRGHMDEAINQAASRQNLGEDPYHDSYNMSSSLSEVEGTYGIFGGYGSSVMGAPPMISGPQSFSEAGNMGAALPSSFNNEVDFALALHRPGVVPMGDSVTTATTSTTTISLSSGYSRSTYNPSGHHQTSQVGSVGSHQLQPYGGAQPRHFNTGGNFRSRSFGEGDIVPAGSTAIPTVIDSHHSHHHQQIVYASSHENELDTMRIQAQIDANGPPPSNLIDENVSKLSKSSSSNSKSVHESPVELTEKTAPNEELPPQPVGSGTAMNPNAAAAAAAPNTMGIFDNPHAYQQQLAAMQHQFQQQQLLLQQQQAALALQQEQLRAYYSAAGINPAQFGLGAAAAPATALNPQQFGLAPGVPPAAPLTPQQQYGLAASAAPGPNPATAMHPQQFGLAAPGYYFVPNQGVGIPLPGQVPGIPSMPGIVPGPIPGIPQTAAAAQLQGLGMPSVGMPGIPGMHQGMMQPPGQQGVPQMPSDSSGPPAAAGGGVYPTSTVDDKSQQIHRQL